MAQRWQGATMIAGVAAVTMTLAATVAQPPSAAPPPPFQIWLAALIEEALHRGFDRQLVERALSRLQPLPRVIQADRAQAAPVQVWTPVSPPDSRRRSCRAAAK
jgi:membrane-bound lytic murein transglycosylase B